jgi:KDO2-lipid IV(A) lauroyltransferase
VKLLFRLLALLPLGVNHAFGALLGRLVFAFPGRYRRRVLENLASSGLCDSRRT